MLRNPRLLASAARRCISTSRQLASEPMRIERDSMGEVAVPASAYYGASTQRAIDNFRISGLRLPRAFIRALGQVKQCAAVANQSLGVLDSRLAVPIAAACQRVIDGEMDAHFPVDVFQTGSGTSTNMNANEVLANLANEALGRKRGSRSPVHPNEHVNCGQSSNDVIPTVTHLAAADLLRTRLIPALAELEKALRVKSVEFWPVLKTGRTHLQDAMPIQLGMEFYGYSAQLVQCLVRCEAAVTELSSTLAIGGTAVGTGAQTHPDFARTVVDQLRALHRERLPLEVTLNHFAAQGGIDVVVSVSGTLNTLACSLTKLSTDIRWMGSGPRAGLGELELPAVQPGSSMMPGKVNPVIAESLAMVCAQVAGNHACITLCGMSGNFELNAMQPLAAYSLLQSIELLSNGCRNMTKRCVEGLVATQVGPRLVQNGLMDVTALVPYIGYDAAAQVAAEAAKSGRSVREVALEMTALGEEKLKEILDAQLLLEKF
jgi:fumarate hydratase, class II